jgi:hypothetical protein
MRATDIVAEEWVAAEWSDSRLIPAGLLLGSPWGTLLH